MKSAKKSILKAVAKVGAKSAEFGASSASMFGFHQPKEPKALQNLKKESGCKITKKSKRSGTRKCAVVI